MLCLGILGISWGRLDMRRGLGSSWWFDSLEACRPYNLGYFGEGATKESRPASRQGKCVFKESGPAKTLFFSELVFWFFGGSGRVDPAKPGSFSQFGVFFGRVPLKNKVLPPDTVGFDGSSRDNWCYAWGSWGFPGTSGYENWTGFELVSDSLELYPAKR